MEVWKNLHRIWKVVRKTFFKSKYLTLLMKKLSPQNGKWFDMSHSFLMAKFRIHDSFIHSALIYWEPSKCSFCARLSIYIEFIFKMYSISIWQLFIWYPLVQALYLVQCAEFVWDFLPATSIFKASWNIPSKQL